MKRRICLAFTTLCFILVTSCSHKLDEIHMVPQQHRYSMVIAGDSSEFKDSVRQMVIDKYRSSCSIDVVNISQMKTLNGASYDVVVIMDTCMAWSGFNPSLKSFLDSIQNREKTVLSMTAGDPEWTYSYQGVDAITSASLIENQASFFARIDAKIESILSENPATDNE
jgi:hypothetical protein